jgi:hypothetical protein
MAGKLPAAPTDSVEQELGRRISNENGSAEKERAPCALEGVMAPA